MPTRCGQRVPPLQRLSWRGFAVCKNFRNYRRKFINSRARHDDAVAAAVSFLCDTQEPAALIFAELDIEVLALNLQFFRLDDVVHFALRAPSLGNGTLKWKKNPRLLRGIYGRSPLTKTGVIGTPWNVLSQARRFAALPAPPRLSCAFDPGALNQCLIPSILVRIHPRIGNDPPSRCRLKRRRRLTIHTLHSVSEISLYLQRAIYCRLPGD